LPTQVDGWPPEAGADRFLDFIKKELIPLVESNYRVRPYRILCGHSFGGVFCIDTFLKEPDLFTTIIAISPSLSWDNHLLLKKAEISLKDIAFNKKSLFLVSSGDDIESLPALQDFTALLEKYSPKGLEWRCDLMEKEDHLSVVHPTIYNALLWLHQGWRLGERALENMTLEQVKDHYQKLSQRYGSQVPIPEGVLFNLGYSFLNRGNHTAAIGSFGYCIQLYPGKAAGYFGLGEVYLKMGKLELAKRNFMQACEWAEKTKDSLALAPAREQLNRVLEKLKKNKESE